MRCKASLKDSKEYYENNEGRYYEERDKAFLEHIKKQAELYIDGEEEISVMEFCEVVEEFTFPDIEDWMSDEYEGMLGDCEDRAYEEARDAEFDRD